MAIDWSQLRLIKTMDGVRNIERLLLPTELDSSGSPLTEEEYDIVRIHDAVYKFDERRCVEKYPEQGPESYKLRDLIDKRRADVEREYNEANDNPDGRLKYSWVVAQRRVRDCFAGIFIGDRFTLAYEREKQKNLQMKKSFNIFDIYDAFRVWESDRQFLEFGQNKMLQLYPEQGPGADKLKKLIDEHREHLEEEYQKAKKIDPRHYQSLRQYSLIEAEHQVRDCFAGTFEKDTEVIPKKEKDESDQTYDIFDIKKAIDHFDAQTFYNTFKYASKGEPDCDKINQEVCRERASIQVECEEAICNIEVEHGSGFIVSDHFIITNKHVIETCLNKTDNHEIHISNAAIGDLSCEVSHHDVGKDLALLSCRDLNLEQCEICPLQLSNQSLLPGMSVFCFGYPMSHTGETALFVSGNVSGSKEKYGSPSMIVLNCPLNSGNSGGPVLRWVNGQLKVVGVVKQKHFYVILTRQEMTTIENIRKSLQTHSIPDMPDSDKQSDLSVIKYYRDPNNRHTPIALLTLKLYDALETHSQFNLSNAIPGELVVDFIKDSIKKYTGEHEEELPKVVNWLM